MLASITPLGERGRHATWGVTVTAFLLGSVLAGLVVGAALGAAGSVARRGRARGGSGRLRSLGRRVIVDAHGLRVELPRGWSGRVFGRSQHMATLHAGDFQLPLEDGEFGAVATAAMAEIASFLAL